MPREVRVEIPAEEGGEEAKHMEEDAPAPQQGGRADTVVISRTEYELLSDAHQRLEKLEEHFTNIEAQSATHTTLLWAILDRLPPVYHQQRGYHLSSHQYTTSSGGIIFHPTSIPPVYHQQRGYHLPSHLGSSSELLHRLAEDVKLSAHERHPTVYPFIFIVMVFTFIFILFSRITFVFSFQRQKGYFSSSLGVCYEPCQSRQFSNSQSRLALSM
jgi:hypothetical protein